MGNKAAWLLAAKQRPLKVDDAPMPEPGPDDIIIRNHAVAINRQTIRLKAALSKHMLTSHFSC